jgi:hypothetical protein
MLPLEAQRNPARGEDLEMGAFSQEIADCRRSIEEVFKVVQDKQGGLVEEVIANAVRRRWGLPSVSCLVKADRSSDGGHDEVGIRGRREVREPDAMVKLGES